MDIKREIMKKVNLADFVIKKTVGTGSFGRVKLVYNSKDSKHYALKILKKSEVIKLKQVEHILSEVSILNSIDFPLCINMVGMTQDDRYLYIVMEYVPGGELFTYLRSMKILQNEHAKFYGAQVVLMFEFLHGKNIVYRDLKPENLLIDVQGYLKLTDFGFAKVIENRTYTLCGTPEYLAPEIILNKGHGKAVDWWCLGILVYEMLVGIDPFSDDEPMAVYQNIIRGKIKFTKTFNEDAKSLVKHLLVADLTKRYGNLKGGAKDIKEHRWLKGIEWKLLLDKKVKSPFIPRLKAEGDTSNYQEYPDSPELPKPIKSGEDPFLAW
jgi:protein kinase X